MPRSLSPAVLVIFFVAFIGASYGQNPAGPQPVPLPPPIPLPIDKPYEGTISLSVDLTNLTDA